MDIGSPIHFLNMDTWNMGWTGVIHLVTSTHKQPSRPVSLSHRTHIPGTKLALLTKSHHPFHGWNFEVITYFKFNISSSIVGLRFLLNIGCFQPNPYHPNIFQCLIYYFRFKELRLSYLKKPKQRPIYPTIEWFRRFHGNTWMITIIIGELNQR